MLSSSKRAKGGLRFFSALMAIVLAIGLMPLPAFAATASPSGDQDQQTQGLQVGAAHSLLLGAEDGEGLIGNLTPIPEGVPKTNDAGQDVVYISLSHDGKFLVSDGDPSNVTMANVAIPISEVAKINLADYGFENYAYAPDGVDEITVLHLYLYVLSHYYSGGADDLVISGSPGSMYIQKNFWGFDENFTYYANFEFPLAYEGWGATADQVVLRPGLHVDLTHFNNWDFYSDPNNGHCFFFDASKEPAREAITLSYSANVNEPIELGILRGAEDYSSGSSTGYSAIANQNVYCGESYITNGANILGTTDENGKLTATFAEPGTYYVWTEGLVGDSGDVVSGPAMATVTVKDSNAVPAELQLSKLEFRSGSGATTALRTFEPAFDPAVKEQTLIVPSNNVTSVGYAWATLADGASGDISIEYPHASSGTLQTKTLTSGSTSGVSLANSLVSNSTAGNTLTVKVGGEEAYVINVKRAIQLNTLKLTNNGTTLALDPAYAMATNEYSLVIPADAQLEITPTISNATLAGAATITVAGQQATSGQAIQVSPTWSEHSYDLVVKTSAEGVAENVYTIHCAEQASSLEIAVPPTKTAYDAGSEFDPAGMQLKATFADGSERLAGPDEFTYSPTGALKLADSVITVSFAGLTATQPITINSPFEGSGTETDPFLIKTAADYDTVKAIVSSGDTLEGAFLKQTADITLSDGWTPIGSTTANCFSGILDGDNHLITVPADCPPLLGFVKFATVKNLDIFGERINGAGLVDNMKITGVSGDALILENVTLKSGSSTLRSGLVDAVPPVNAFGVVSAGFMTTIKNCTVEEGVTVGYGGDLDYIGGFAGRFQGVIENSTCNATVKGANYVGGFLAMRANAMGFPVGVKNSTFGGSIVATGEYVGGIAGAGYVNTTAPNAGSLDLVGNTVTGSVIGGNKVGGILGGDAVAQQWSNLPFEFKDNTFTGTISATAEGADAVGAIAGYYRSLNRYADIAGNTYDSDCGAEKGIGKVDYVDTSSTTHETESGTLYFNTETSTADCPSVAGCSWKTKHNRTDDPLGADAGKLCIAIQDKPEVVTVDMIGQGQDNAIVSVDGKLAAFSGVEVSADKAAEYGFGKPADLKTKATTIDALVALHELLYGEAFKDSPGDYLVVSSSGTMRKVFGTASEYFMFHVNDGFPLYEDESAGSLIDDTVIKDGDKLRFFGVDSDFYGFDVTYLTFDKVAYEAHEDGGVDVEVNFKYAMAEMPGMDPDWDWEPAEGAVVSLMGADGDVATTATVDEDGVASFEALPAGDYYLVVTEFEEPTYEGTSFSTPYATLTVSPHEWASAVTLPTFEAEGSIVTSCTVEGCEESKTEVIPAYGFTVTVDGQALTSENITVVENGYDASYLDWTSGEKVESHTPLVTVTMPKGFETSSKVEIELGNSFNAYQNYVYTAQPDDSGYTQYVDYGFGDQIDTWNKVAEANKAYEAMVLPEGQVYRVQSAYDANGVSYNLYAIAFKVVEPGFTIKVNGEEIAKTDILVDPSGYDASYTDWQTGEVVASFIPLYTVKLPAGIACGDNVQIALDNFCDGYQSYIYDVAKGENGYVDMGFGDETEIGGMPTVVASANTEYSAAVLPVGQIYRIQTAYDPATWASDNLYAIAFEVSDETFNAAVETAEQKAAAATSALADANAAAQVASDAAAAVESAEGPVAKSEAAQASVEAAQAAVDAAQAAVAAADEAVAAAEAASDMASTDERKAVADELVAAAETAKENAAQAKTNAEAAKAAADAAKAEADEAQATAYAAAKETAEQKAEAAAAALADAQDAAEAAKKAADAAAATADPAAKAEAAQAAVDAAQAAAEKAQAAADAAAEAVEAANAAQALAMTDEQKAEAEGLVAAASNTQEKAAQAQAAASEAKMSADAAKKAADEAKKAADEAKKPAEEAAKVEVGKTYKVNGMTYKVTKLAGSANGTVTLVKAKNAKKVVVPAKVKLADGKSYNVDVIATKAFKNLKKLTKVTVGANVKKIQKSAFFKTPKLKNVVVKSKLLKKKASVKAAFKGSKVKKITVKVPKKLKKAYKKSFAKKNIKAPKAVTVK